MSRFEDALTVVLAAEGGFVHNPADPGGPTNLGITRATLSAWRGQPATEADVAALTREEAAAIYRARYWDPLRADALPPGISLFVFDEAVHSGTGRAARSLQRALGLPVDGRIGRATLEAARAHDPAALLAALAQSRRTMLRGLKTFPTFGRGWMARVDAVERRARALLAAPSPHTRSTQQGDRAMFETTKGFFTSRTVWGALVAIAAQLVSFAGYSIPSDAQSAIVEIVLQLLGIGGAAAALWGRLAATHRIG